MRQPQSARWIAFPAKDAVLAGHYGRLWTMIPLISPTGGCVNSAAASSGEADLIQGRPLIPPRTRIGEPDNRPSCSLSLSSGCRIELVLNLDANFLTFVGQEDVDVGHDAAGYHVEVGIHCGSGPDGGFSENGRFDSAPSHIRLRSFAMFERDGRLNRELQIVGYAFFWVFAFELARDCVL